MDQVWVPDREAEQAPVVAAADADASSKPSLASASPRTRPVAKIRELWQAIFRAGLAMVLICVKRSVIIGSGGLNRR
jgi:hypothetical protein